MMQRHDVCFSAAGSWQLAAGSWQLATGNWQLAIGNWQLATGEHMAEFQKVASASEIAPGETKAIEVGGASVALYNVDGAFFATNNVCSHDEAYLAEGWLEDDVIICPAHGAEFCVRDGQALSLPATEPVATYPVRVEGDDIYVAVGE